MEAGAALLFRFFDLFSQYYSQPAPRPLTIRALHVCRIFDAPVRGWVWSSCFAGQI